MQDNVGVELKLYPGAYHGFDRVPEAQLSQQFVMDRSRALKRAITPNSLSTVYHSSVESCSPTALLPLP